MCSFVVLITCCGLITESVFFVTGISFLLFLTVKTFVVSLNILVIEEEIREIIYLYMHTRHIAVEAIKKTNLMGNTLNAT